MFNTPSNLPSDVAELQAIIALRDAEIDRQRDIDRFQTEETSRVEDHTTKEFFKNVVLFKGGAKAMDIYRALHPEGKFRD